MAWNCPKCGKVNYVDFAIAEVDGDIKKQMIEDGIDEREAATGNWYTAPDIVECDCGLVVAAVESAVFEDGKFD